MKLLYELTSTKDLTFNDLIDFGVINNLGSVYLFGNPVFKGKDYGLFQNAFRYRKYQ